MRAKLPQSCLTLCDPMDYSLPGSSVIEILQARILEWVAMPSSVGSSWSRDQACVSYAACIIGVFFTSSASWGAFLMVWEPNFCSWWNDLENEETVSVSGGWGWGSVWEDLFCPQELAWIFTSEGSRLRAHCLTSIHSQCNTGNKGRGIFKAYVITKRKSSCFGKWIMKIKIQLREPLTFCTVCMLHAELLVTCLTLCNTMDCGPPGSSVHGILQVRILEWLAMHSSRGSFWPRDWTCISDVHCIGGQVPYH